MSLGVQGPMKGPIGNRGVFRQSRGEGGFVPESANPQFATDNC